MIRYAIGLAVAGLVIVAGAVYVRQVERLCPQSCPCPQSRAVAHKVEMVAYWMDVSSVLGKIVAPGLFAKFARDLPSAVGRSFLVGSRLL